MDKQDVRSSPLKRSFLIAFVYLLTSWFWITFSDALVEHWFDSPEAVSLAQTYKGIFFVLVTALVLFWFLHRLFTSDQEILKLQEHQNAEILKLNQFRQSVIERANVWINVLDSEGRVVLWNRAAEEISGYSRDEVMGSDNIWPWLYPDAEVREQILVKVGEILRDEGEVVGFESVIRNKAGEERQISWNSRSLRDEHDEIIGSIAIGQDITDIRKAESLIRQRDRQLVMLMDNLPGMAYRCRFDEDWTMLFASSGCRELTGYDPEELIDNKVTSFASIIRPDVNDSIMEKVGSAIANAEVYSLEYPITRKDGSEVWIWERGAGVSDGDDLVLEGIMIDITERKVLEEELSEMATRDPLTGLFNRRETTRLLDEEIARATRYNRTFAVFWIDMDHFKAVNDEHGHASGDRVLKGFAEVLEANLRNIDIVGRFGGEEFVVVLPEKEQEAAEETAERLLALVASKPQALEDGQLVNLTMSIGIALFPEHGTEARTLLAAADTAMYGAKHQGRNRVVVASGP